MGKGERTRAAILDQAIDLASVRGLEAISIGDLAGRMSLSKSGLFAHFGSKEALQRQVLEISVERFRETVLRPALKRPRGEPRLRGLIDLWLIWNDDPERPGGCPLLAASLELDDVPGQLRDYLADMRRQFLDSIARIVEGGITEGQFRPDLDAHQVAFEINALIYGHVFASRLLRDREADRFFRAAFDRLLKDARARS